MKLILAVLIGAFIGAAVGFTVAALLSVSKCHSCWGRYDPCEQLRGEKK